MQLIRSIHHLPLLFSEKGCALTIGNFDGVHLGHQGVLNHLKKQAKKLNLPVVVMVFEPQPSEYFMGENAPARLMRLRDKLHYLQQLNVDYVFCVKFNRTFSEQSAENFISEWLVKKLNVKFLSIGDDFRFGLARKGDFHLLQEAGDSFSFVVENNKSYLFDNIRVSSTEIRQALANNNLNLAEKLLGKPYRIWGRVAHGNKLGRTINFPTANIRLHRQVNPVKGVYAVKVILENEQAFFGVANIGKRPTIDGVTQILEVHIFNFSQNLYGQHIQVEFCFKIRDEIKFPSFEMLKAQIHNDAEVAKQFFGII